MPIKIDFLANVRDFLRGTADADEALDDVASSLDDMADAAKTGGRDAERSVDDLESSFRDAARRAKDLGDAGRDAGRDVDRGMRTAEDGVEEFKDEANSTAREAAASFDGSAESIADAFQEIAANAFAGFGPAGAVAGLAAAAGIGLAVSGFDAMNAAAEESAERAADWADAYIEAGGRVLSFEQQMAKVRDILTDPEMFKEAETNAKNWGVSFETAVAAAAGSASALAEANESLAEKERAAAEEAVKLADGGEALADMLVGATGEARAGRDALNALTGEMERGGKGADAFSRILVDTARNTAGATEKVDEFGDTVITLPDGHKVYIDAETGQATQDVDAIEKKVYGIKDKNVDVNVHANTGSASAGINRFIAQNNGRVIKIYGRYVSPPGDGNW